MLAVVEAVVVAAVMVIDVVCGRELELEPVLFMFIGTPKKGSLGFLGSDKCSELPMLDTHDSGGDGDGVAKTGVPLELMF